MNSEQEKIIATFSKRSMGAPFLFVPDRYRTGKTSVQPCDLVWACNGCILLFSMIESGRSREKMARHNFNHMKGFYKEWQCGRNLKGRNNYSSFDISFDQYPHKVLISVVNGGDATSELNPVVGEHLATSGCPQPTLCATISLNVLGYIADHAGSVIDLLLFLDELRDPIPAEASLKVIRRMHNLCFNFGQSERLSVDFRNNPVMYTLDTVYTALRSGNHPVDSSEETPDSFIPSLLSDLSWSQLIQIVCHTRNLERKAGSLSPGMLGIRAASTLLDFRPYLFGLNVSKSTGPGDFERFGEQVGFLQQEILNHANYRERFSVIFCYNASEQGHRSFSAFVMPAVDETAPTLKSQTVALLDGIRTRSSLS